MWPSQNFLLYNGTTIKINEWMNNLKKNVTSVPPPLWRSIQSVQIITIEFQKRANDFNTSKV